MKILTSEEMRLADKAVFSQVGIPSRVVMETAGREVVKVILELYGECIASKGVLVLVGGGNNGGDGFVVARTLLNLGYDVDVFLFKPMSELKGDAKENAQAFLNCNGEIEELKKSKWQESSFLAALDTYGIVIDAIYGTGFKGELSDDVSDIVYFVNDMCLISDIPIVSIDIPSGLNADTGEVGNIVIEASTTIALEFLKPCHVLFPASGFCGNIYVADLGFPKQIDEIRKVKRTLLQEQDIHPYFKLNLLSNPEIHKGEKGHMLVIGGSKGHYGAPLMSAKAALRCSSGLVTLASPVHGLSICNADEIMYYNFAADEQGAISASDLDFLLSLTEGKDALAIGPGIGQSEGAWEIVQSVINTARENEIPIVVDADALNLIAAKQAFSNFLFPSAILTPHPGEMARLLYKTTNEIKTDRIKSAVKLAEKCNCLVVLKGARTVISSPEGEIWINPTACEALATAGSGDVLTGVIAALLARGFSPKSACFSGVFIHGAAGELAVRKNKGMIGTVASDLITNCSEIMNAIDNLSYQPINTTSKILPQSLNWLK